ncbi:MAG: hypothetical protein ACHQQS_01580 [Thermoanaerobaculales bacterium]
MDANGGVARGLLVLADGAQTGFAAGAVAELARGGVRWQRGAGAGLGAQIVALALLGEAEEGERRWRREAELGCPLLASRLAAAQRQLGEEPGVLAIADASRLEGWLDPIGLVEHIAPEAAALPQRLAHAGASCVVAVANLRVGSAAWQPLDATAVSAREFLRAAASFPCGWGAVAEDSAAEAELRWGGVALLAALGPPWSGTDAPWDVVSGFPFPVVARPALGRSLLELVQRRDECLAAATLARWCAAPDTPHLRVVAPTTVDYAAFAARDTASLGVEYPLPWERNGELLAETVRFGSFVAAKAASVEAS